MDKSLASLRPQPPAHPHLSCPIIASFAVAEADCGEHLLPVRYPQRASST